MSLIIHRLFAACMTGDSSEAIKALEQNPETNYIFYTALAKTNPWFICAANGHVEVAKLLLEHQELNEVQFSVK